MYLKISKEFGLTQKEIQEAENRILNNKEPEGKDRQEKLRLFYAALAKNILDNYPNLGLDFIKRCKEKFQQQLKEDCKRIIREKFGSIEDVIFKKCFEDFIRTKNISQLNCEEFQNFFCNRKSTIDEESKNELLRIVESDLKAKSGFNCFIRDATRNNGRYLVCEIKGDQITYSFKDVTNSDNEDLNEILESRCRQYHEEFKSDLQDKLREKKVEEKNIEKFRNFIFYLFSQVAEVTMLNGIILKNLFGNKECFLNGFDLRKSFLDIQIQILNSTTVEMKVKSKDGAKLFTTQILNMKDFIPSSWHLAIKNPRSEFTFELQEDQWTIKSGSISFEIVKNPEVEKKEIEA